jgi:hypothetical protein
MDLREVNMKYGRLVVFIRNDCAKIWGFRYGLKRLIGTLWAPYTSGPKDVPVWGSEITSKGATRQGG